MSKGDKRPIGVFDSGLGGLTVVKELMRVMPKERIVYYGDTARVPYGTKSEDAIVQFSIENTTELLKHDVKMVVVACNSSSSYAMDYLRSMFKVPIVGVIEPGVRAAIAKTESKRIGLIATSATVASQRYQSAIEKFNGGTKVFAQSCPLLVPLVEEGWVNKDVTKLVLKEYLAFVPKHQIDTLILGCTHYPLLKSVIRSIVGSDVKLIDSAKEIVKDIESILENQQGVNHSKVEPKHEFIVTDHPQSFRQIAKRFLGIDIFKEDK